MNVDTGHLRELTEDERNMFEDKSDLQSLKGMTPVPPELDQAAKKKLAGQKEAYVSLTSGGRLSKWAAQERKKRRKTAAESRRRNRQHK